MSAASNRDRLPLIACGGARSHSGRGRGVPGTSLFEREPEGKKALRGVDWQAERQTLVANVAIIRAHSSKAASAVSGSRRAASASALPRR
jgi:hypothetical protein